MALSRYVQDFPRRRRFLAASSDLFHNVDSRAPHEIHKTMKLELQIRNALYRLTILLTTMSDELSLVPVRRLFFG